MIKSVMQDYFLFPHMVVPERDLRNLLAFLPRLSVFEIAGKAAIPGWAKHKFSGRPAVPDEEVLKRIESCVRGYRDFAEIHGGADGTLSCINRALEEIDEPRYRIQEELRGKCPTGMDPGEKAIVQAAILLEIARELDEKELELETSFSKLNTIEREFRDILGIDEEAESFETDISPPLLHDSKGLLYLLPRRIQSWFRMPVLQRLDSMPVFVTSYPEVLEEILEMIRTECESSGTNCVAATFQLGSIPGMDGLGEKQFRSVFEAPETPEILSTYRGDLESLIAGLAEGIKPGEIEDRIRSLQGTLDKFCRQCEMPGGDLVSLSLTLVENVSLTRVLESLGSSPGFSDRWPAIFLTVS